MKLADEPYSTEAGTGSILQFYGIACLISWTIWMPLYLPYFGVKSLPVFSFEHGVGTLGPLIACFIMVYKQEGRTGIKNLTGNMITAGRPLLLLVAFLAPFLLLFLAALIQYAQTTTWISFSRLGHTKEFPSFSFATYFVYNLVFFGYGEETGWKGYMLPRLQSKFSALLSSMVFTAFWAAWHIPLFFYRPGYTTMDAYGIVGWFFSLLTGSILLTWLFNASKGSILVCAVFHTAIDMAFVSDAVDQPLVNRLGMLLTLWGILTVPVLVRKNKKRVKASAHT